MSSAFDILIKKDAFETCRIEPVARPEAGDLTSGQALFKLDEFALTANNITYAAFGEAMHYWDFFPAPEGWGKLPVWGFAEVVAEKESGLSEGERIFGFWPMGSFLVMNVGNVSAGGFEDVSEHRASLAAVYNRYVRTAADPGYVPELEALQMLFRPLFMTDFLLDDFLVDNELFGADQVVLSSASSKTAFGLAFLLARGKSNARIVGLTSAGNVSFVEGLGCYGAVASYDGVRELDASRPTVYVDFAGNAGLRADIHEHWGSNLTYSCAVGGTHWHAIETGAALPGPRADAVLCAGANAEKAGRLGSGRTAETLRRVLGCIFESGFRLDRGRPGRR